MRVAAYIPETEAMAISQVESDIFDQWLKDNGFGSKRLTAGIRTLLGRRIVVTGLTDWWPGR